MLPGDPGAITGDDAARLRALGFAGASITVRDPDSFDDAALVRARTVLADHGIRVAQANASYPALVHPDEAQRAEGIRLVQRACRAARVLDAVFLLVRSGSVNPGGNYWPHRENHTPETRDRLIDSLRQVCAAAETEGVTLGLECHVITTLESPAVVREIIEAAGSPALRYNADPVNFVGSFREAYNTSALLHHVFGELGRYIVGAHVKDVCLGNRLIVHLDECAPGEGIFDIAAFMQLYERCLPDGYVLIEHLPNAKIPEAKRSLDRIVAQAGIVWRK
ncbi:MAG: sugar phosphate isomerase/epimerase [Chloroflexi bacterium]|nr:sugar phosphate isomerase/epimerase [Chloroflexota bacterium]